MDRRQQVEGKRPTEADISIYHGDSGAEHEWRAATSEKKWLGGPLIPSPFSRLPLSLPLSPSLTSVSLRLVADWKRQRPLQLNTPLDTPRVW